MHRPVAPLMAWHFLPADLRLGNGDGREVRVGETLRHDGPLVMCKCGLHASERILDALGYPTGPVISRVRCGGEILRDTAKLVCGERTVEWMLTDTDDLSRGYSRWCARSVLHLWDAPEIVLRYLDTGDESIRAAAVAAARASVWATRDAAWAASDAARASARASACASVWASVWPAARASAVAAAWAAATAASEAAWAAARAAQNAELERLGMGAPP